MLIRFILNATEKHTWLHCLKPLCNVIWLQMYNKLYLAPLTTPRSSRLVAVFVVTRDISVWVSTRAPLFCFVFLVAPLVLLSFWLPDSRLTYTHYCVNTLLCQRGLSSLILSHIIFSCHNGRQWIWCKWLREVTVFTFRFRQIELLCHELNSGNYGIAVKCFLS